MSDEPDFGVKTDEAEKAARRVVPPITQPSLLIDPATPWVPPEVGRRVRAAAAAGWRVRLFHAIGPRLDQHEYVADPAYHTLGLRLDRGGLHLIAVWGYRPDVAKPGWRYDVGFISPGRVTQVEGRDVRLPIDRVTVSVIDEAIRS